MIDIRDLTIGDWVFDGNHTKFPMQITSLSEGYVTMSFPSNEGMDWESKPEDLMGIPLKGELLKKIGFKYYSDNRYELSGEGVFIVAHPIFGLFRIEKFDSFHNIEATFTSEKIRSLHELQNAFYLTTKQQLNIKL